MNSNKRLFSYPLRIILYDQNKKIFDRVFEHYPVVIGRSPKCDIPLAQYDFLSRQHCAITEEKGAAILVDLNSTNGFNFQGRRSKKAPLQAGIEVDLGTVKIFAEIQNQETLSKGSQIPDIPEPVTKAFLSTELSEPVKENDPEPPTMPRPLAPAPTPAPSPSAINASRAVAVGPKRLSESIPQMAPQIPIQQPQQPVAPRATAQAFDIFEDGGAAKKLESPNIYRPPERQNKPEAPLEIEKQEPAPAIGLAQDMLLAPHPFAGKIRGRNRALEGFVTWKDQIYDVRLFYSGSRVSAGRGISAGLRVPTLKWRLSLASFDSSSTRCFIPQGATAEVTRNNQVISMAELMQSQALTKRGGGYVLKLGDEELVTIELASDVKVHFRYAPLPKQLTKALVDEKEEEFRKASIFSGIVHLSIAILFTLTAPPPVGPKLEKVDPKYARLLVQPPKPLPKKPDPPKQVEKKVPEEKKIVKKVQPKPKPVVMKESKVLKQEMKQALRPANTTKPQPKAPTTPPPVNVEAIGALAALSALPTSTPTNIPASININPNAGGKPGPQTSGMISNLKLKGGQLAAGGGMGSLKTKGLGYGTGTGYGTQGLSGQAGSRGVVGAVVGSPKLFQIGTSEGLSRAEVMAVVKQHAAEVQSCYERSLLSTPGLSGRVEYEWEINPAGSVVSARVKKSEMSGGDALNACVVGVFKKMKFPQAKNGQSTTPNIGFPFGRM